MSSRRRPDGPAAIVFFARMRIKEVFDWTRELSEPGFIADTKTRAAVERNFISIGESVRDLNAMTDLSGLDPSGPWSQAISFRNFLAHVYAWETDSREVWATVQNDLPNLDAALARIEPLVGGPYDPDADDPA